MSDSSLPLSQENRAFIERLLDATEGKQISIVIKTPNLYVQIVTQGRTRERIHEIQTGETPPSGTEEKTH